MWHEVGYDWPKGVLVEFKDQEFYGASGYLVAPGDSGIWILERGYPHWEAVLDHEVGMLILDAYEIGEGVAIQRRKELGICYPGGDTGYCNPDE